VWPHGGKRRTIGKLPAHGTIALSADGRYVAWAESAIVLHDVRANTTRELAPFAGSRPPFDLQFVGDRVAAGELTGEIRVIAQDGTITTLPGHRARIEDSAASVDGKIAARGPRGGTRWKPRFFVRRLLWHALDHLWEIEDRSTRA
jgi:hypothetical protein